MMIPVVCDAWRTSLVVCGVIDNEIRLLTCAFRGLVLVNGADIPLALNFPGRQKARKSAEEVVLSEAVWWMPLSVSQVVWSRAETESPSGCIQIKHFEARTALWRKQD
jgi:hypothetical protein